MTIERVEHMMNGPPPGDPICGWFDRTMGVAAAGAMPGARDL